MTTATLYLILPLIAAFLIPIGKKLFKKGWGLINVVFMGLGLVLAVLLVQQVWAKPLIIHLGGWQAPFGIALHLGPVGAGGGLLIYLIAFLVSLTEPGQNRDPRYFLLFNLLVFSSLVMVATTDLFNLFVMIEIGSIALVGLMGSVYKGPGSRAGLKYLIPSGLTGMLLLAGIALLYSAIGNLSYAGAASAQALNTSFAFLIGLLIIAALLFETELFPFNSWVPDAYRYSTSGTGAAIAGILGTAAALATARVFFIPLGGSAGFPASLSLVLIGAALISVLFGELAAYREKDLKKMLGYSSVGQMGVAMFAVAFGAKQALTAGLFLLLAHALAKPLLLLLAGFFQRESGQAGREALSGAGRRHPLLGGLFAIGALSLTGLPLFAGFWGKLGLVRTLAGSTTGAMATVSVIGLIVILAASVVEGIYLLRIAHKLFEKPEDAEPERKTASPGLFAAASMLALLIIAAGLFPGTVEKTLGSLTRDLTDVSGYIRAVIGVTTGTGAGL